MGGDGGDGERSKLGPLADQYLDRDMRSLEEKGGMRGEGRDEMGPPADQY